MNGFPRTPTQKFILSYLAVVGGMHVIEGPWRHWTKGKVIDMWTLTHVVWSMIARSMGVSLEDLMKLAALNEGAEFFIRRYRPDMLWGTAEDAANVAADLAANYVGYQIPIERIMAHMGRSPRH